MLCAQIEESYISAAELGRLCGLPAETVLRTELTVLQGLEFDLITYSPHKSVDAFVVDLGHAAAAGSAGPELSNLGTGQLQQAKASAYAAVDALMLTDAPLLHSPGQLALAATRSAFTKVHARDVCPISWLPCWHLGARQKPASPPSLTPTPRPARSARS